MTKKFAVAAFSAAFLLCGGGLGFAQTPATHGTTMGTISSTSSELKGPITSESQLKQDLQAKGYSDVSDVKHEGNYYTATAKHSGQNVKLRVDASSGMVTQNPS